MSIEQNKTIVRRYYEELWNKWSIANADELIAAEITFRGSLGLNMQGIKSFKEYMAMMQGAFPDFHNAIEELIAEGDQVVARMSYSGTHRGELYGLAPTGKHVTYSGIAIFRIQHNKIVAGWVIGDALGLMKQLGAVHAPGH
ncbi:MAG: ester cyclase [Gammaproteobacteria bacterium]